MNAIDSIRRESHTWDSCDANQESVTDILHNNSMKTESTTGVLIGLRVVKEFAQVELRSPSCQGASSAPFVAAKALFLGTVVDYSPPVSQDVEDAIERLLRISNLDDDDESLDDRLPQCLYRVMFDDGTTEDLDPDKAFSAALLYHQQGRLTKGRVTHILGLDQSNDTHFSADHNAVTLEAGERELCRKRNRPLTSSEISRLSAERLAFWRENKDTPTMNYPRPCESHIADGWWTEIPAPYLMKTSLPEKSETYMERNTLQPRTVSVGGTNECSKPLGQRTGKILCNNRFRCVSPPYNDDESISSSEHHDDESISSSKHPATDREFVDWPSVVTKDSSSDSESSSSWNSNNGEDSSVHEEITSEPNEHSRHTWNAQTIHEIRKDLERGSDDCTKVTREEEYNQDNNTDRSEYAGNLTPPHAIKIPRYNRNVSNDFRSPLRNTMNNNTFTTPNGNGCTDKSLDCTQVSPKRASHAVFSESLFDHSYLAANGMSVADQGDNGDTIDLNCDFGFDGRLSPTKETALFGSFRAGQIVEIMQGALKGKRGMVKSFNSGKVAVTAYNSGTPMELQFECLELRALTDHEILKSLNVSSPQKTPTSVCKTSLEKDLLEKKETTECAEELIDESLDEAVFDLFKSTPLKGIESMSAEQTSEARSHVPDSHEADPLAPDSHEKKSLDNDFLRQMDYIIHQKIDEEDLFSDIESTSVCKRPIESTSVCKRKQDRAPSTIAPLRRARIVPLRRARIDNLQPRCLVIETEKKRKSNVFGKSALQQKYGDIGLLGIHEVKERLQELGMNSYGNKAELLKRLHKACLAMDAEEYPREKEPKRIAV
eukprot:scaffold154851_cov56-Attheya_sp.AAC.1